MDLAARQFEVEYRKPNGGCEEFRNFPVDMVVTDLLKSGGEALARGSWEVSLAVDHPEVHYVRPEVGITVAPPYSNDSDIIVVIPLILLAASGSSSLQCRLRPLEESQRRQLWRCYNLLIEAARIYNREHIGGWKFKGWMREVTALAPLRQLYRHLQTEYAAVQDELKRLESFESNQANRWQRLGIDPQTAQQTQAAITAMQERFRARKKELEGTECEPGFLPQVRAIVREAEKGTI